MSIHNLQDLLGHELQDLYSAETQLVDALPKMEKAATSSNLKNAFSSHLAQTKQHVERLEQACELLEVKLNGDTCDAMKGLIKEGEKMIKEKFDNSDLKDQGLIACAQRVEHYEIAGYGTARSLAEKLGRKDVASILDKTLQEEGDTDKKLTQVANAIPAAPKV
jgi:ferritin-like metal-binding protein YciE